MPETAVAMQAVGSFSHLLHDGFCSALATWKLLESMIELQKWMV
jgi:hypothetical protein